MYWGDVVFLGIMGAWFFGVVFFLYATLTTTTVR